MAEEKQSTLPQGAVDAIIGGYHGDPFGVLGPHQEIEDGKYTVRTFQPHVKAVTMVDKNDGREYELEMVHPDGLYEVALETDERPLYHFLLTPHEGDDYIYEDPYRFGLIEREGRIYERQGAHLMQVADIAGTYFSVWAPNAERVSVVGPFNGWDGRRHVMRKNYDSGTWSIFIPGVAQGTLYKYEIKTAYKGYMVKKSDPVGFYSELRPNTASIVWDVEDYEWEDDEWMNDVRPQAHGDNAAMSVYEVHAGSWKRKKAADGEGDEEWVWLSYRELADELIPYAVEMGYTHIEFLPIAEHPFDGSWGYQVTGYYAPTSRFGTPQDLMYFVDKAHQAGIGIIVDWVPAHFPKDEHGLGFFDGTYLYEHADPRLGEHPDWGTKIFNYGRGEVRSFLIDNALFWLEKYHIDGLRVDAVASMLYLDFSREDGEWIPNRYGGRENIEAISFLRDMNDAVHRDFPHVLTVAEESTAWPGVTRSTDQEGGLGFNQKWNMGWMNDTLRYMSTDSIFRSYHQGTLTFSLLYAFSEKYVLAFSHDEVVHLKRSMVDKMPGDMWQKFANLRALYGYQYSHPGRKLNFMGNELAQWSEWTEEGSLHWHLLDEGPHHIGMQTLIKDLNRTYKDVPALHEMDDDWQGFEWIDFRDAMHSVLAYMRLDQNLDNEVIVVCNFTPEVQRGYRVGVPNEAIYHEFLNTDHERYGGSGIINGGDLPSAPVPWQDRPYSLLVDLPPLGVIYLKRKS